MSCSKPLLPFVCDSLYYLNREQLELFSIVCRPLKNFIERYLHSKPYRVFVRMQIRGGSYALDHNCVHWHHDREDYFVQQFFATQEAQKIGDDPVYYSFTEMRPFLGPTVRIMHLDIYTARDFVYSPEDIAEMESVAYLWRDGNICICSDEYGEICDCHDNLQPVLNSPIILQCRGLLLDNPHLSFKNYNVLYSVKVIEARYDGGMMYEQQIDPWQQNWQQFLEQPRIKPIVGFGLLPRAVIGNLLDRLSKAFSSAVSPNAFTIVFAKYGTHLPEFREMNNALREKLELKKGLPSEYQNEYLRKYDCYTLNFPSKPYRIFDELYICCGENEYLYSLLHRGNRWQPNQTGCNLQQFLDGEKCNQELPRDSALYSLPEMRPYFGENVRVKTMVLIVKDETILNVKPIAEMETIAHIWSDRELVIAPYRLQHFTDQMVQRIQPVFYSEKIFYVRKLMIQDPKFSFKDYLQLNSLKFSVYIVVYNSKIKLIYCVFLKTRELNLWLCSAFGTILQTLLC